MLSGSTAANIAANEAVIADDTSVTRTTAGKIETITFSMNYHNRKTNVTELVPYLKLTFKWDTDGKWSGMTKEDFPIAKKYM